jgi:hypothetical protein
MSIDWDTDVWEDGLDDCGPAARPLRLPWSSLCAEIWPDGVPAGMDDELARWGLSVPTAGGSRMAQPADWGPIVKAVAAGVRWAEFAEVFRRKREVRFKSMAAWELAAELSVYRFGPGVEFILIEGSRTQSERIGVRVPRSVAKNFAVHMRSMRAWRVAAGADGSRARIVKGGDFYSEQGKLCLPGDAQFFWSVPSARWDELLHYLRFVHPVPVPVPLLPAEVADEVVIGVPSAGVFTVRLPRPIPQVGDAIKLCGGKWDPSPKHWVLAGDRYDEFVVSFAALFVPR